MKAVLGLKFGLPSGLMLEDVDSPRAGAGQLVEELVHWVGEIEGKAVLTTGFRP